MNLEEFADIHHPEWRKEFERFSQTFNIFQIGTKVRTLRAGFGGYGGDIRVVVALCQDEQHGRWIELANLSPDHGGRYLLYEKTYHEGDYWWNAVEVINETVKRRLS